MSRPLVEALEKAFADLVQRADKGASVLVQFAADDYQAVRAALTRAREELDAKAQHGIADAAGVVSHTSSGQPLPAETRLDMVEAALPAAASPAEPAPAPAPEPVPEPAAEPAATSMAEPASAPAADAAATLPEGTAT